MIPENMALSVTDVLCYHQKEEHLAVPARSFSAISLRLNTPGKYLCRNKPVSFDPPSVCIVPEGVPYGRVSFEDDILVIHFKMYNFIMEEIEVYPVRDPEKYRLLFEKAWQLRQAGAPGAQYAETAVLYEIFAALAGEFGFQGAGEGKIAESAEYIKRHFSDPELSVEDLARRASVSPAQYRRKFRQVYGMSPKRYLDSLRFRYAKSLLETGYYSQKEIAFRCGFSDVDYFRTAFRRETGQCIRDYCAGLAKQAGEGK